MKNDEIFKMTYSAEQQEEIGRIRRKYIPKQASKLEQLRALDAAVGKKASMRAIIVGVLGAILLGCGMSLIMTDFGAVLGIGALPSGIAIGVVGLAVVALAYPLYQHTLRVEREKIAPEILRLSDELMK